MAATTPIVASGLDRLLGDAEYSSHLDRLRGASVGLLVNPTSVTRDRASGLLGPRSCTSSEHRGDSALFHDHSVLHHQHVI